MLEELASAGRLNGRGRGRAPTHPRAFLQPNPKKDCAQLRRRAAPNPEEGLRFWRGGTTTPRGCGAGAPQQPRPPLPEDGPRQNVVLFPELPCPWEFCSRWWR